MLIVLKINNYIDDILGFVNHQKIYENNTQSKKFIHL